MPVPLPPQPQRCLPQTRFRALAESTQAPPTNRNTFAALPDSQHPDRNRYSPPGNVAASSTTVPFPSKPRRKSRPDAACRTPAIPESPARSPLSPRRVVPPTPPAPPANWSSPAISPQCHTQTGSAASPAPRWYQHTPSRPKRSFVLTFPSPVKPAAPDRRSATPHPPLPASPPDSVQPQKSQEQCSIVLRTVSASKTGCFANSCPAQSAPPRESASSKSAANCAPISSTQSPVRTAAPGHQFAGIRSPE